MLLLPSGRFTGFSVLLALLEQSRYESTRKLTVPLLAPHPILPRSCHSTRSRRLADPDTCCGMGYLARTKVVDGAGTASPGARRAYAGRGPRRGGRRARARRGGRAMRALYYTVYVGDEYVFSPRETGR